MICPTQPEPIYYAFRTLSTALANARGADLPATFSNSPLEIESYGFAGKDGERLIAFWLPGVAEERAGYTVTADLAVKGSSGDGATVIDVLDGTEQSLQVERTAEGVIIRKLRVPSWPLIVRMPH
jgi:hypothetical protein